MRATIRLLLCALLVPAVAQASNSAASITLLTGPKTGTYYAIGHDIGDMVRSKKLRITVLDSEGSIDNIRRIHAARGLTLGIVQSDVLGFLSRSNNPNSKKIISGLRVMFPFYQEEVHVLARKPINDFSELQGKKVAVGEEGSGNMLTAVNLFAIEQVVPSEIRKIPPEEGVVEVLKGDLDAVIFVGGKPVRIFKNMEDLTKPQNRKYALMLHNVHFLPLNSARFYAEYEPTEITSSDYDFVKTTVPTIAVQAVMVSSDADGGPARCEALRDFASSIRKDLPQLRQNGHPKWSEASLQGSVLGWKKDRCFE